MTIAFSDVVFSDTSMHELNNCFAFYFSLEVIILALYKPILFAPSTCQSVKVIASKLIHLNTACNL
jgi:hypothetical protein